MKYDTILFDLDGTLTDSGPGIMRCCKLALEHFGIIENDEDKLRRFVGPPLVDSFMQFYGLTEEQANEATEVYRADYRDKGVFENSVYPGIPECLKTLQKAGKKLLVATSKPEAMAFKVLRHYDLEKYFYKIGGASLDMSRSRKDDVLQYVLDSVPDLDKERAVMVGDRCFDMNGAKKFGLHAIGVSFGYGSVEELTETGAEELAADAEELLNILMA